MSYRGNDRRGGGGGGYDDNRRHNDGHDDRGHGNRNYDDRRDNRDNRGQGNRGYENRDQGNRGYDNRDQGNRGYDNRDQGNRGYDNRDQGNRGYDNRDQGNRGGYDNRGQGNRGYDERRDQGRNNQYDQRDGGSRGGSQHGSSGGSNSSQYGGSQYTQHSGGHNNGGRDGYGNRGQGGNDLNRQMGQMNIRDGHGGGNRGGNQGGMYSQNAPRGGGTRVHRPTEGVDPSDLAGSAQHPRMPVAKKDMAHLTQTFAERPAEFVHDKKIGEKVELFTNHALVHLPEETIKLNCYDIKVIKAGKEVIKREEASPLFWSIVNQNRVVGRERFVFNDVNMLWTINQLQHAQGQWSAGRPNPKRPPNRVEYKITPRVDLGKNIREDQDMQLLATLVDLIATARARSANGQFTVFKRCMYLLNLNDDPTLDHPLCSKADFGVDVRIGISIGIRLNLRAGITACFDVNHTLFNRPKYPLIRMICELIEGHVITDDEFENRFDQRLRDAPFTEDNRALMDKILTKMNLRYSMETGIKIGKDGKESGKSVAYFEEAGKEFKYYQLTSSSALNTKFFDNDGREWTIANFFLDVHNIRLRYPNLPCMVKKPSRQNNRFIAFPMEFVTFVAHPHKFQGFMSDITKKAAIRLTEYTPGQRLELFKRVVGQTQIAGLPAVISNEDNYMRTYNVQIEKEMLSVKATVLPPPTVVYGEDSKFTDVDQKGEWEAITNDPPRKVLESSVYVRNPDPEAPKIKKRLLGSVLQICSPYNKRGNFDIDPMLYNHLMKSLDTAGQPIAWNKESGQPAMLTAECYQQGPNQKAVFIWEFLKKVKAAAADPENDKYKESEDEVLLPFVLVVFEVRCSLFIQRANGVYMNDYNFMKYLADNETGVYTQGILRENLEQVKEDPHQCKLTRLIVEKMLGKVGTTHRKLEREGDHKTWTKLTNPESPTLILGVDVSHPSVQERDLNAGDVRRLSVATVVGNIDTDCTEYRASSRLQEVGTETIVSFEFEVNKRINEFIQANNGKRPAHIVVYRDGLAESDFQRTLYEERRNIEKACEHISKSYEPTITYIVVTKRHHTRFFLKDEKLGHEKQGFNTRPGTLVEDTVTTNQYYDFFLTTQVGEMGVARPTHYYVLHNTWPQKMASFWPTVTHALTYMFCRTTSTVALPAPVLYAHLAAKRAKECLDGAWHTARFRQQLLRADNFADVANLTQAINVNNGLDGMIFV